MYIKQPWIPGSSILEKEIKRRQQRTKRLNGVARQIKFTADAMEEISHNSYNMLFMMVSFICASVLDGMCFNASPFKK